jgi:hypothetical protein
MVRAYSADSIACLGQTKDAVNVANTMAVSMDTLKDNGKMAFTLQQSFFLML